jgi:2,3-bisphosphoglycerate-independent phosphoglycerate mutase
MVEHILVLFLDGVGLGDDDPSINPLVVADMPTLGRLLHGHKPVGANAGTVTDTSALKGIDAQLDTPGLPQSGTGQVSLMTGLNAAAYLGYHDGPYPNRELQLLLARDNLFSTLRTASKPVDFANAYSERFLQRLARGTQRLSANARAAMLADIPLHGPHDLAQGNAISSLLTNDYFRQIGHQAPDISPEAAGGNLARIAHSQALTFFEFWYSDVVGHRQDWDMAMHILSQLDRFLAGVLNKLDLDHCLFVMISDHGNLEDLSTSKHTTNPALCVVAGADHTAVLPTLNSLTDFKPTLTSMLLKGH